MSLSNFAVLPPKIVKPKNLDFNFAILRFYYKYIQIVTKYK